MATRRENVEADEIAADRAWVEEMTRLADQGVLEDDTDKVHERLEKEIAKLPRK